VCSLSCLQTEFAEKLKRIEGQLAGHDEQFKIVLGAIQQ
jgi:hypothetical protein